MRLSLRFLTPILVMLLTAASFGSAVYGQQVAEAVQRQIVNIAEARWDNGGGEVARPSNSVVVAVEQPATGFTITPYRLSGGSGSRKVPVATPLCQGSAGVIPTPLDAAAALGGNDPSLAPTQSIHGGEPLYFTIAFAGANTDPTRINTLTGAILSQNGADREVLTIAETGANTGVFAGVIQTRLAPPSPVIGDCLLTVSENDVITVQSLATRNGFPLVKAQIDVLVDPYGVVFDSEDGTPIDGVTVTLIDDATGQPADVRGDDGVSKYPSTMVSGQSVTDSSGRIYPGYPGDYRFPLIATGRYHLVFTPPAPYSGPSKVTPAGLTSLRRTDGMALTITDASYGKSFAIDTPEAVRIDIPLDRPRIAATVTKTANVTVAAPGDVVLYTVTVANPDTVRAKRGLVLIDTLPAAMRLRADTVRVDGVATPNAMRPSADGGTLTVDLGNLSPGATRVIRYALEVRPDAGDGVALNSARTRDAVGTESTPADFSVRIARETIADRLTVIGRVTDGGCGTDRQAQRGVGGVRILLEDGSYAITDRDGRYHLQGIRPGVHVVALEEATLPPGTHAVDCGRNTRTGGSAISRFVEGSGGSLHRADFHVVADTGPPPCPKRRAAPHRDGRDRQRSQGRRCRSRLVRRAIARHCVALSRNRQQPAGTCRAGRPQIRARPKGHLVRRWQASRPGVV